MNRHTKPITQLQQTLSRIGATCRPGEQDRDTQGREVGTTKSIFTNSKELKMTARFGKSIVVMLTALVAASAAARAEFTPVAGFDKQLFPSYLIATAGFHSDKPENDPLHLGDPMGLLGVEVVSPGSDTPVKVTIQCDEYFEASVYSGKLAEKGKTYHITPKIKYHYDRLAKRDQAAPMSVTFRVQLGYGAEEEHTVTCTMRSINDCPFAFKDGDEVIDTSFAFAAYVNEQHPFVDKLLREALDRGVVKSFQGYQAGDPGDVMRQAYAIWDLLVARDVRYSSITTTAVSSESVASQHVRLLEDSVNNSQANCVDGSVLWVSLLRKIGIDGFLVMTPNHCYAGFYLDPKHEKLLAIETTLIGVEVDPEKVEIPEGLEEAIPENLRYEGSFASYVAALGHGTKTFIESAEKESKEKESEVQVIDIAQMRKLGILPIAFQKKEDFVSYDFTEQTSEEKKDDGSADKSDDSEETSASSDDSDKKDSDTKEEESEEGDAKEDSSN